MPLLTDLLWRGRLFALEVSMLTKIKSILSSFLVANIIVPTLALSEKVYGAISLGSDVKLMDDSDGHIQNDKCVLTQIVDVDSDQREINK